ncbi:prepilin peptidase dependent protein C [Yersinia frederiksenii]|nr:prepilin peptidase dependent protein C [Yersinia frederiksenii]CQH46188.1 prepilin peptidase dependent protein C [Yersinia frederiksenii]
MYSLKYHHQRQLTQKSGISQAQLGFSLPEALIAALFFSVSLLGLLQYHQSLLQGFSSLWQQRQAWSSLHQHIDRIELGMFDESLITGMISNGIYRQSIGRIDGECTELNFTLAGQHQHQAELTRWFCSTSDN